MLKADRKRRQKEKAENGSDSADQSAPCGAVSREGTGTHLQRTWVLRICAGVRLTATPAAGCLLIGFSRRAVSIPDSMINTNRAL